MLISYGVNFLLVVLLYFCDSFPTMGLDFGYTISLVILLHHGLAHFFIQIACHFFNNFLSLLHHHLYFELDHLQQLLNLARICGLVVNARVDL